MEVTEEIQIKIGKKEQEISDTLIIIEKSPETYYLKSFKEV